MGLDGQGETTVGFAYDGGGIGRGATITLSANGTLVGTGRADKTVFARFGIDTFGIGEDTGQPVTPEYRPPFAFTGRIEHVDITLEPLGLAPEDHEKVRQTERRAAQRRE